MAPRFNVVPTKNMPAGPKDNGTVSPITLGTVAVGDAPGGRNAHAQDRGFAIDPRNACRRSGGNSSRSVKTSMRSAHVLADSKRMPS